MDDMKQKTITTDKATLLVVELPEGVKEYHHSRAGVSLPQGDDSNLFISGNWQLLGRLPDITEDQCGNIVPIDGHPFYKDYSNGGFGATTSATKSGLSLLQANEVFFDNPLGDEPVLDPYRCLGEVNTLKYTSSENDIVDFKYDTYQWQEAQSKVWDKERCYLFIKVD